MRKQIITALTALSLSLTSTAVSAQVAQSCSVAPRQECFRAMPPEEVAAALNYILAVAASGEVLHDHLGELHPANAAMFANLGETIADAVEELPPAEMIEIRWTAENMTSGEVMKAYQGIKEAVLRQSGECEVSAAGQPAVKAATALLESRIHGK